MISVLRRICRLPGNSRRFACICRSWLMMCAVGGWVAPMSLAQVASTPAAQITTVGQFWDAANSDDRAGTSVTVDLELLVLYYDPAWALLWVQQNDVGGFLPSTGESLNLRPGDRVRITGTVTPEAGFDPAHLTVQQLESQEIVAEPLSVIPEDPSTYSIRYLELTGYVDQQSTTDANHLLLELIVGSRKVLVRVWMERGAPVPHFGDQAVTVQGLFVSNTGQDGSVSDPTLWVPEVGGIAPNPRMFEQLFEAPTSQIADLANLPNDRRVQITGLVFAHDIGHDLVLRDESGQLVLRTPQSRLLRLGETIEVTGYPDRTGLNPTLREAIYRPLVADRDLSSQSGQADAALLSELRLAQQILRLPNEELAATPPVTLTGVVTYVSPHLDFIYLNDSSASIRIDFETAPTIALEFGSALHVSGTAGRGNFAPTVVAEDYHLFGRIDLPVPRTIGLAQALSGSEDGQWIGITGYLREVTNLPEATILNLIASGGEFTARLPASSPGQFTAGSVLRLRGVCTVVPNEQHQLQGITLLVANASQVTVEEAASEDIFAIANTSIASLQQYESRPTLLHRTKVTGTVTHHLPGRVLWVQDESGVLEVLSRETDPLEPGQIVELVGLPGRVSGRFVMHEAVYRAIGAGPEPSPISVNDSNAVSPNHDGRLVRVRGTLVDLARIGARTRLYLNTGQSVVECEWEDFDQAPGLAPNGIARNRGDSPEVFDLEPGSELEVIGVYQLDIDEFGRDVGFGIQMRDARDITVVKSAPWWNTRTAQNTALLSATALALGLLWVTSLRQRVRQQTAVIREQAEAEQFERTRYAEIVDQATDFIFTLDLEGNFTSFNAAGERLTGYSRAEALTMSIFDLLDETASRRTRLYIKRQLNPTAAVTFEVKLIDRAGRSIDVETSAGFICHKGRTVCCYGIMRDIRSRKAEEQRNREHERQMRQSQKLEALGTLAGGIAHDFNNILAAILSSAELSLYPDTDPRELKQHLEQINRSGLRARELVRRILSFSRVTDFERKPTDLREVVGDACKLLRSSIPAMIEIDLQLAPDTPLVLADADQIHQVTMNICTNAWHALPENGGRIEISVTARELTTEMGNGVHQLPPGRYARLRIRDNGSGMTREIIERIYDPFFTTKMPGKGTGLGLAMVHGIVKAHKGGIFVESQAGQGSAFDLYFPATTVKPRPVAPASRAAAPRGNGEHILFVDDEESIGLNLEQVMTRLNYRVTRFLDPVEAEAFFHEHPDTIDLVFSDLSMPERSGKDLAEVMLARRPEMPFIIYTGNVDDSIEEELRTIGVQAVLRKPTPLPRLAAILAETFKASATGKR